MKKNKFLFGGYTYYQEKEFKNVREELRKKLSKNRLLNSIK